jgi:two-component system response regulator
MSDNAVDLLLVEDSPDDVEFFKHAFEKTNVVCRIHVVADGVDAIEFVLGAGRYAGRGVARPPRLIVLDLKLPLIGGLEVLQRLKADKRTARVPIVVFSSSQEETDLLASYEHGANSYIVKPMEFDQFDVSVRILVEYWLELNQTPKTQIK